MAQTLPVLSTSLMPVGFDQLDDSISGFFNKLIGTVKAGFVGLIKTTESVKHDIVEPLKFTIANDFTILDKFDQLIETIKMVFSADSIGQRRRQLIEERKQDRVITAENEAREETNEKLTKIVENTQVSKVSTPESPGLGYGAILLGVGVLGGLIGTIVGVFDALVLRMRLFVASISLLVKSVTTPLKSLLNLDVVTKALDNFKSVFAENAHIDAARDFFKSIGDRLRGAVKNFKSVLTENTHIDDIRDFFNGVVERIRKFTDPIVDSFRKLKDISVSMVDPIKSFFANSKKDFEFIRTAFNDGIDVMKSAFKPITDMFTKADDVAKSVTKLDEVFAIFKKFFSGFRKFAKFLGGPITLALVGVLEAIEALPKIWDSFQEDGFVAALKTTVDEAFRILVGDFGNIIKDVTSWIAKKLGFSNLSKALDDIDLTKVWNEMTTALFSGDFMKAIDDVVGVVSKFLTTLWGGDEEGSLFKVLSNSLGSLGTKIGNFIDGLLGYFKPVIDYVDNYIEKNPGLKQFKLDIEEAFNGVASIFDTIVDKVSSLLSIFSPTRIVESLKSAIKDSGLVKALSYIPGSQILLDALEPGEKKEKTTKTIDAMDAQVSDIANKVSKSNAPRAEKEETVSRTITEVTRSLEGMISRGDITESEAKVLFDKYFDKLESSLVNSKSTNRRTDSSTGSTAGMNVLLVGPAKKSKRVDTPQSTQIVPLEQSNYFKSLPGTTSTISDNSQKRVQSFSTTQRGNPLLSAIHDNSNLNTSISQTGAPVVNNNFSIATNNSNTTNNVVTNTVDGPVPLD